MAATLKPAIDVAGVLFVCPPPQLTHPPTCSRAHHHAHLHPQANTHLRSNIRSYALQAVISSTAKHYMVNDEPAVTIAVGADRTKTLTRNATVCNELLAGVILSHVEGVGRE